MRIETPIRSAAMVIGGLALALSIGTASADELRIASGTVSKNALNGGMDKFAELIEQKTDGEYTGKVYPGTLLTFAEMLNGVRDGIVDVGFNIPAYARAEFPQTNFLSDMSTASADPVVMLGVVNEYMFNCEPCLKEFDAMNHVFLGFAPLGPYYLMSLDKIQTLEDFSGKTIRGVGPFGRWVEAMGGKSVVVTAADVYEALNQGQIDGNTQGLDTLKSQSFGEIVDYVLDVPIGLYLGSAMYDVNRDTWNDLSEEHKRAFIDAAAEGLAWTVINYYAENAVFLDDPASGGVELVEPDEALAEASAKFQHEDLNTVAEKAIADYGIDDANARVETVRELVTKWEGLTEGLDTEDPDAVATLLKREVFDKINPDSL
ncbi:C4-dicarboxylate TRAP transporter substrate-binding protein [Amorphus sp. 3PC139-8]|uniref:C4-dicarboxylate TRAP transporter substrate-binding protein n=1 Tax=Amorphus sp. 3PC139-8 TaxID=2735676 RepID=UPI00345C6ABC